MLDPDSPLRMLENAALRTDAESTKHAFKKCIKEYQSSSQALKTHAARLTDFDPDHKPNVGRSRRLDQDEIVHVNKVFTSCYAAYRERQLPAEIPRDACCKKMI